MKTILKAMLAVIAVIALSAANNLAALKMAEQTLARNRTSLLAFTIPVAALGCLLFMAGIVLRVYQSGKPMSHAEVEDQYRITQSMGAAPYVARWSFYRIFGKAEGRQFAEELPIGDFKLAWQNGAWRRDKVWRARFAVLGGALMAVFGVFAAVAVVSPILFSLVCAALLIYSAVRLTWAQPLRNTIAIRIALYGLLSALCLSCSAVSQVAASSSSEQILDYHSDIRVQQDASLLVRETIRVHSASVQIYHGIYRDFPTRYKDRLGNSYVIHFEVVEVLRDGQPEKFHVEDQSNGERIYFGDQNVILAPGDYTYTLVYTVNREIGFFADHDEIYWNVTGTGWLFPIAHASATVTLPENIPVSSLRMDGYTGPQGARGKAFTSSIGTGPAVSFACTQSLPAGEGLTLVVSWPKGYIRGLSGETRFRYFLEDNRATLVGAAGLLVVSLYYVMVWLLVRRGPAKSSIMPIYEPPAGLSPAAMRYLVRMGFDDKAFTVAVLDMAVKGYLSIKEKGGIYTLKRSVAAKESAAGPELLPYKLKRGKAGQQLLSAEESAVAAELFPTGQRDDNQKDETDDGDNTATEIRLQTKNHEILSDAIAALKKSLHAAEDKIYFVTNQRYLIPGVILSVATLVGISLAEEGDLRFVLGGCLVWLTIWSVGVIFLVRQSLQLWKGARAGGSIKPKLAKQARSSTFFAFVFIGPEIVALSAFGWVFSVPVLAILVALVALNVVFHRLLKAPTSAGRQLLDKIEGFGMFLRAVDGDRLNRLTPPDKTPELFEKYLPYAVALDCEEAWAQQFSTVLENARRTTGYSPTWYSGGQPLGTAVFASSLGGSFSSAIAAASSAPGTSSGGGGGGSSGGGGGGGGGGGW